MDSPLFFEDIQIGRVWVSPRRTVTEADVVNFATMTGDLNPLHVDYDFAGKSHYRRPVAHGLLGLSWVAGLGSYFPHTHILAFKAVRDWQFTRPLFFGDTVYVETTCLEKAPSGRRAAAEGLGIPDSELFELELRPRSQPDAAQDHRSDDRAPACFVESEDHAAASREARW